MSARIEIHATVEGLRIGAPLLVVEIPEIYGADQTLAEELRRLANRIDSGTKFEDLIEALQNWGAR